MKHRNVGPTRDCTVLNERKLVRPFSGTICDLQMGPICIYRCILRHLRRCKDKRTSEPPSILYVVPAAVWKTHEHKASTFSVEQAAGKKEVVQLFCKLHQTASCALQESNHVPNLSNMLPNLWPANRPTGMASNVMFTKSSTVKGGVNVATAKP